MNVHSSSPIGVFDSGLGGLSVVRQLRSELPRESILYAADSHFCPYGERSLKEIRERSLMMVGHLIESGAKLVVVACNTASAAAIEILREQFDIPIIAMEPAVKPAVTLTITGKIAVLATPSTVESDRLQNLIDRYGAGLDIRAIGVPGLADCIETGHTEGPVVRELLAERVECQIDDGVDVIVLGCTHYPFAGKVLDDLVPAGTRIIDSGNAVARRTRELLMTQGLLAGIGPRATFDMITTGDPEVVRTIAERLLGEVIHVTKLDARVAIN